MLVECNVTRELVRRCEKGPVKSTNTLLYQHDLLQSQEDLGGKVPKTELNYLRFSGLLSGSP